MMGVKERYVFIETFGCQMNENDTTRMLRFLGDSSFIPTDEPSHADVIILNTCSIRDKAEEKVYSAIGRFRGLKGKNPHLILGISGCLAQQKKEELLKRIPYLDMVVGTNNVHRLPSIIKEITEERKKVVYTELSPQIADDEYPNTALRSKTAKAFVNIMRGCDNFCTYCIVPYVRGKEVSRRVESILEEVSILAINGVKEVTLVGQNVNSYAGEITFPELLRRVCRLKSIRRVRFITAHPKDISDELIRLFGEEETLARSIHLPLQSGSDKILKRMERGYTLKWYLKKVNLLKKLYPDISVSADIIVGFPGETEKDFLETMAVIKEVEFDGVFSFKYSPRPFTNAARFEGQVPEEVKQTRLELLQSTQRAVTIKKNTLLVGRLMEVLVEGRSKRFDNEMTGRTACHRIVNFPGDVSLMGKVVDVTIEHAYANSLKGTFLKMKGDVYDDRDEGVGSYH